MLNLDTHILVHAMSGALRPVERRLLEGAKWGISAIVLWEFGKLVEIGRLDVDLDDRELGRFLAAVHVWPLDFEVVRAIRRLDFKGDPADEIIAATSLVHGVPLVTRDRTIRASKVVPLA